MAAGMFTDVIHIPERCNIAGAEWEYKWKSDLGGMVDGAVARMVAMVYSQVEGVDYFKTIAATASATSNRSVAAMGFEALGRNQGFIQSNLDTDIFLGLSPGCESISRGVVRLNKASCGLEQSGRAWCQLLSSFWWSVVSSNAW